MEFFPHYPILPATDFPLPLQPYPLEAARLLLVLVWRILASYLFPSRTLNGCPLSNSGDINQKCWVLLHMIQEGKKCSWIWREHKAHISEKMICGPLASESSGIHIKSWHTHTHTPPPHPPGLEWIKILKIRNRASVFLTHFLDDPEHTEVWKKPPLWTSGLAAQFHLRPSSSWCRGGEAQASVIFLKHQMTVVYR